HPLPLRGALQELLGTGAWGGGGCQLAAEAGARIERELWGAAPDQGTLLGAVVGDGRGPQRDHGAGIRGAAAQPGAGLGAGAPRAEGSQADGGAQRAGPAPQPPAGGGDRGALLALRPRLPAAGARHALSPPVHRSTVPTPGAGPL